MLYIDPSEATPQTCLPQSTLDIARLVSNLESLTGADILVSPYDSLPDSLSDIPPHQVLLRKHCTDGILVQRKSGGDFLSSIPDLSHIQARMSEWSPNPWLLITRVREGNRGQVVVSGSRRRIRWNWKSVRKSMDCWQHRGGSVGTLQQDEEITEWLQDQEKECFEWLTLPVKNVPKPQRQQVTQASPNWYNTGRAWPEGIGQKMLENLARYIASEWHLPPTLANAISLATNEEALEVRLWGVHSMEKCREWYGVNRSHTPVHLGAESACWIYDVDTVDVGKMKRVEVHIGKDLLVIDGQVWKTEKHQLGTVDDVNEIPKGAKVVNV